MKKLFNLALAGTMILAALACQREPAGLNEADNGGVKEVTTQFVLNVASAPKTKLTADMVQQNENFRGIQDGVIYTYKTQIAAPDTPYILDPNMSASKTFEFPFFFASGGIDNTGTNNQTDQNGDNTIASKRVLQLSIPIETDAILFYGKAIADGDKADVGATEPTSVISDTPKNTVIKAQKILDEANRTLYDKTGDLMIYIINEILGTSVDADNQPGDVGTYHYLSLPKLSWAQLGHQYEMDHYNSTTTPKGRYTEVDDEDPTYPYYGVGHAVQGLEETLGKCYYLFTYLTPSDIPDGITFGSPQWKAWVEANPTLRHHEEYRAGSSAAVRSMIIDMYKIISAAANDAEATDDEEANAKRLAEKILDSALKYFIGPEDKTKGGQFKSISNIKSQGYIPSDVWTANFEGSTDLNKYPFETYGIPEGAAQIGFKVQNGTTQLKDEFYYKLPNQPLVNPTMADFEPKKYLYPAELWYYVNSPIRTSNDPNIVAASYPDGVNKWKDDDEWDAKWTSNSKVTSSTRAIAVTNSINYGVALLKSVVSYGDNYLNDNRDVMTEESTPKTIYTSAANIQLRGILVGGQNPRMNWQFIRKYENEAAGAGEGLGNLSLFDGVVYDHSHAFNNTGDEIPVQIPALSTQSATFYTLVYDNYNSSEVAANQNDVYVALEFINGGEAFWGRDNLIPKDGVFYLVGKLPKPTADQISNPNTVDWPTDHQIPPVDAKGLSQKILRVFIQDFVTTVYFKIQPNSLRNAYYSVPDLRASQMSLGLSVDLKWETGLTYNINL